MKRRIFNLVLLALTVLLVLASCSTEGDKLLTVRFSIVNDRARTISSGNATMAITKYTFTLSPTGRSGNDIVQTFEKKDSGTYDIPDITPGSYKVKVQGKTDDDEVIAEASKDYFIERNTVGTDSVMVELVLTELTGKQNVNIVYKWDVTSYNASMTLKLTVRKQEASESTTPALSINSTQGTATYTAELDAGSYIFIAELINSSTNKTVLGHTDVIRVTNSTSTLSQTISIDGADITTLKSSVIEKVSSPIEGTITITKNTEGQRSYTVSLQITKKPDGVEDKDIKVNWYNEEKQINGGQTTNPTETLKQVTPYRGYTQITAVMWCDDIPGSMGAATAYCNNQ